MTKVWQTQLRQLAKALEPRIMKTLITGSTTSVVCHGDLWPDHTYFQANQFTGFVDFGALNYTSSALDLAQLILHFGGWQTAHEVLSTYTQILSLTKQDRALVTQFAAWDLIHEGCWTCKSYRGNSCRRSNGGRIGTIYAFSCRPLTRSHKSCCKREIEMACP